MQLLLNTRESCRPTRNSMAVPYPPSSWEIYLQDLQNYACESPYQIFGPFPGGGGKPMPGWLQELEDELIADYVAWCSDRIAEGERDGERQLD